MNLQCPQCKAVNLANSKFCNICGVRFNVIPKKVNSSLSTPVIILITVLSLCSICGICGLVGKINEKNTPDSTSKPATISTPEIYDKNTIRPLVSTETPAAEVEKTKGDNTDSVPAKSDYSNKAIVITENANLRKTGEMNSAVTQTLPEGVEVEVIEQKGAWFLVRYSGQTGWVHGNTIKYKNDDSIRIPTETVSKPTPVYQQPKPSANPTGATARCRDGTLSYSRNRRGTCSHHGGVAVWY